MYLGLGRGFIHGVKRRVVFEVTWGPWVEIRVGFSGSKLSRTFTRILPRSRVNLATISRQSLHILAPKRNNHTPKRRNTGSRGISRDLGGPGPILAISRVVTVRGWGQGHN